jgi:hypothetical protein
MKAKAEEIRTEPDEFVRLINRAARGRVLLWAERLFPFLKAADSQRVAAGIQRAISRDRDAGACSIFQIAFDQVLRRAAEVRPDIRAALTPILQEIVSDLEATERSEAEYERRSRAAAKGWARRRSAGAG